MYIAAKTRIQDAALNDGLSNRTGQQVSAAAAQSGQAKFLFSFVTPFRAHHR
jgi:hypothetical protein